MRWDLRNDVKTAFEYAQELEDDEILSLFKEKMMMGEKLGKK